MRSQNKDQLAQWKCFDSHRCGHENDVRSSFTSGVIVTASHTSSHMRHESTKKRARNNGLANQVFQYFGHG